MTTNPTQVKKDLSSAKERVKEALKREQEERNGPRKRRFVSLHIYTWYLGTKLSVYYLGAEVYISIYLSIRMFFNVLN